MPQVSVIIPAFNEEDLIGPCIESLLRQSFENFEAIIIDDASTDSTKSIIKSFSEKYPKKIKLREYGKVGPGRARNIAAKECDSEILAYMDADCFATPQWLTELVKGFTNDFVASTGGPHLAPPSSTHFQLQVEQFLKRSSGVIEFYKNKSGEISETSHNPLCNVAYKKKIFESLNGFREDLWPGEDYELDERVRKAGYRITYNPRALVFHHRPETIEQFRKVMFAYGRSQGKLVRENGPRRLIHWLGLLLYPLLIGLSIFLVKTTGYSGLFIGLASILIIFSIRPKGSSQASLRWNALEWFTGFWQGFLKNRSDPPVLPKKSS